MDTFKNYIAMKGKIGSYLAETIEECGIFSTSDIAQLKEANVKDVEKECLESNKIGIAYKNLDNPTLCKPVLIDVLNVKNIAILNMYCNIFGFICFYNKGDKNDYPIVPLKYYIPMGGNKLVPAFNDEELAGKMELFIEINIEEAKEIFKNDKDVSAIILLNSKNPKNPAVGKIILMESKKDLEDFESNENYIVI